MINVFVIFRSFFESGAKVRAFFVQVIIKTSIILITSYKYVRNLMILFKIEHFDKIILRKIRRKSTHFLLFSKKSAPTFFYHESHELYE